MTAVIIWDAGDIGVIEMLVSSAVSGAFFLLSFFTESGPILTTLECF